MLIFRTIEFVPRDRLRTIEGFGLGKVRWLCPIRLKNWPEGSGGKPSPEGCRRVPGLQRIMGRLILSFFSVQNSLIGLEKVVFPFSRLLSFRSLRLATCLRLHCLEAVAMPVKLRDRKASRQDVQFGCRRGILLRKYQGVVTNPNLILRFIFAAFSLVPIRFSIDLGRF